MPARFSANRAGIAAMLATPEMVAAMGSIADRVEAEAVRIAPVVTGQYVNGITSDAEVDGGVAVGRVTARAPHSVYVEYGNSRGAPRQRVLGRALDAINLA